MVSCCNNFYSGIDEKNSVTMSNSRRTNAVSPLLLGGRANERDRWVGWH